MTAAGIAAAAAAGIAAAAAAGIAAAVAAGIAAAAAGTTAAAAATAGKAQQRLSRYGAIAFVVLGGGVMGEAANKP
jgi:hypothetical protein